MTYVKPSYDLEFIIEDPDLIYLQTCFHRLYERLILKILVLPIILVLTLLTAVLGFLVALAGCPLSIIASILGILSFITLVTGGGTAAGIGGMVIAFLISPYGLPAVAGWIIEKLADLNYSLKCFLTD